MHMFKFYTLYLRSKYSYILLAIYLIIVALIRLKSLSDKLPY